VLGDVISILKRAKAVQGKITNKRDNEKKMEVKEEVRKVNIVKVITDYLQVLQ